MNAVAQTEVRQWFFEAADLKSTQLIDDLVDSACEEFSVSNERKTDLHLLLCEVITNSIDHGILGLDSRLKKDPHGFEQFFISRAAKLACLTDGSIFVCAEHISPNRIRISVEDSGEGFAFPPGHVEQSAECLMLAYGRGLMIIRNLCHSMTHVGNGNCIVLEFDTGTNTQP